MPEPKGDFNPTLGLILTLRLKCVLKCLIRFQSYLRSNSDLKVEYSDKNDNINFNPTLGLILTPRQNLRTFLIQGFQSYLRSNSDFTVTGSKTSLFAYFNPTLGLILTLLKPSGSELLV